MLLRQIQASSAVRKSSPPFYRLLTMRFGILDGPAPLWRTLFALVFAERSRWTSSKTVRSGVLAMTLDCPFFRPAFRTLTWSRGRGRMLSGLLRPAPAGSPGSGTATVAVVGSGSSSATAGDSGSVTAAAGWSADGTTTGTETAAGTKSVSSKTSLFRGETPDASNPFRMFFLVKPPS